MVVGYWLLVDRLLGSLENFGIILISDSHALCRTLSENSGEAMRSAGRFPVTG